MHYLWPKRQCSRPILWMTLRSSSVFSKSFAFISVISEGVCFDNSIYFVGLTKETWTDAQVNFDKICEQIFKIIQNYVFPPSLLIALYCRKYAWIKVPNLWWYKTNKKTNLFGGYLDISAVFLFEHLCMEASLSARLSLSPSPSLPPSIHPFIQLSILPIYPFINQPFYTICRDCVDRWDRLYKRGELDVGGVNWCNAL
mgnify:CR=1 FL=1